MILLDLVPFAFTAIFSAVLMPALHRVGTRLVDGFGLFGYASWLLALVAGTLLGLAAGWLTV